MKKLFFAFILSILLISPVSATESFVDKNAEWWSNVTPKIIEQMIDQGANINERDEIGWTPLMTAIYYNENPSVIKKILNYGVDINAKK